MKVHYLAHSSHSGLNYKSTSPSQSRAHFNNTSRTRSPINLRYPTGTFQKSPIRNRSPTPTRYNPERSSVKSIDADLNKLLNKMVTLQKEMKKQQITMSPLLSLYSQHPHQRHKTSSPSRKKEINPHKQGHNEEAKRILKIQSSIQIPQSTNVQTLSIRSFVLGKLLGEGKFGEVFLSQHKSTETLYAIKKVFKSIVEEFKIQNQLLNQMCILSQVNHPNVVKLYTCFTDQYHVFMVMEYVPGQTLEKYFNSQQNVVSQIILQVIKGLSYIHSKFVMHRDIKPENIMYHNGTVKIGDFGWATTFKNRKSTTYCGTLDYVSPQVLQGKQYDYSVDLWSLGILAYQLLSGKTPFKYSSKQKQVDSIKTCNIRKIMYPPSISPVAQNFISKLLLKQPSSRMSLKEAQKHPFILKHHKQFKIAQDLAGLF